MEKTVLFSLLPVVMVLTSLILMRRWFLRRNVYWMIEEIERVVKTILSSISNFLIVLIIIELIVFGFYNDKFMELKYKILYYHLKTIRLFSLNGGTWVIWLSILLRFISYWSYVLLFFFFFVFILFYWGTCDIFWHRESFYLGSEEYRIVPFFVAYQHRI